MGAGFAPRMATAWNPNWHLGGGSPVDPMTAEFPPSKCVQEVSKSIAALLVLRGDFWLYQGIIRATAADAADPSVLFGQEFSQLDLKRTSDFIAVGLRARLTVDHLLPCLK